jgi:hypothetical protein
MDISIDDLGNQELIDGHCSKQIVCSKSELLKRKYFFSNLCLVMIVYSSFSYHKNAIEKKE